jgi:ABC-2 type transport system permease protein
MIRELKLSWNVYQLIFRLFFPAGYIFIVGYAFSGIISPLTIHGRVIAYQAFLATGIISMNILNNAVWTGASLYVDRATKMFQQILAGPFTRSSYAFSKILSVIFFGIINSAIVMLFVFIITREIVASFVGILFVLGAIVLGSVFFGALIMTLSVVIKTQQTFNVAYNLSNFCFTFLSSVFYPAENIPQPLQTILWINPLTYIADMLRTGLLGISYPFIYYEILALVIACLVMIGLCITAFKKIEA